MVWGYRLGLPYLAWLLRTLLTELCLKKLTILYLLIWSYILNKNEGVLKNYHCIQQHKGPEAVSM